MRLKASFSLLPLREKKVSHFCGNPYEYIAGKDTLNTNLGCQVQGKREKIKGQTPKNNLQCQDKPGGFHRDQVPWH